MSDESAQSPGNTQQRGYGEHKLKANASVNSDHPRSVQDALEMYVVCPAMECEKLVQGENQFAIQSKRSSTYELKR